MQAFLDDFQYWLDQPFVGPTIHIGLIVLVTVLLVVATNRLGHHVDDILARRLGEDSVNRRETISGVVRWVVRVGIFGIGLISILREIGLDPTPLLAGAGIAGIIIAFGAQNLMKDFLAGGFVLAEHQYGVGDFVRMAGVEGTVERVTLRMTALRDASGNLHIVPNGHGSVVTNETHTWSRALLDVEVAYKEDVDRVMQVLREIGDEMAADPVWGKTLQEPMEIPGVQAFRESGVAIRVHVKTPPSQKFTTLRELRRRVKNRFDAEGIEIPFPHRTVYHHDVTRAAAG